MRDKEICKHCGKIHVRADGTPSCTAHRTGTDRKVPCKAQPIKGGYVCRVHGGSLKLTQIKAQERLALMSAEGEIAQLMRECDIPEQHPIDGLLEVVRVCGSMMRLLTIKVGELREEPHVSEVLVENPRTGELTTKRVADDEAFWGLNHNGEMVPHVYTQLLKIWTERYERACKTALDAGVEERRIRLAEDTSATFFAALNKALDAAGLDPTARAALHQALAFELRKSSDIIELEAII